MHADTRRFADFAEFYPYYLSEHADRTCRRLHVLGTAGVLLLLAVALVTGHWWLLAGLPIVGYGCAWLGHFGFEHNTPATFRYPLYSLRGDFVLFYDVLRGRIAF